MKRAQTTKIIAACLAFALAGGCRAYAQQTAQARETAPAQETAVPAGETVSAGETTPAQVAVPAPDAIPEAQPNVLPTPVYTVPNNEAIFLETNDPDSPDFYPKLLGRYMEGDTTLTRAQIFKLYYGYINQPTYKPLDWDPNADAVLAVFDLHPEPNAIQSLDIIQYGIKAMARDPFSPSNLNFLTYAYQTIGDTATALINRWRMDRVIETIKSTGSGQRPSSPWHIIFFTHATDILGSMGLMATKPILISTSVQYLPYRTEDGKSRGYYFDYSRVYIKSPEQTNTQKQRKGLELNGVKIR